MSETTHTMNGYHVDFYASCKIIRDKNTDNNKTELYNIVCINCYDPRERFNKRTEKRVTKNNC